jgi:hypothetical protein
MMTWVARLRTQELGSSHIQLLLEASTLHATVSSNQIHITDLERLLMEARRDANDAEQRHQDQCRVYCEHARSLENRIEVLESQLQEEVVKRAALEAENDMLRKALLREQKRRAVAEDRVAHLETELSEAINMGQFYQRQSEVTKDELEEMSVRGSLLVARHSQTLDQQDVIMAAQQQQLHACEKKMSIQRDRYKELISNASMRAMNAEKQLRSARKDQMLFQQMKEKVIVATAEARASKEAEGIAIAEARAAKQALEELTEEVNASLATIKQKHVRQAAVEYIKGLMAQSDDGIIKVASFDCTKGVQLIRLTKTHVSSAEAVHETKRRRNVELDAFLKQISCLSNSNAEEELESLVAQLASHILRHKRSKLHTQAMSKAGMLSEHRAAHEDRHSYVT